MTAYPFPVPRRVLLVATEAPTELVFRDRTHGLADTRGAELFVVCPPLGRFLERWTSDVWPARTAAAETLERTLAVTGALGLEARGCVGADEPRQALDDALRTFAAGELILVTGSQARQRRLEQQLVRFAHQRVAVPIIHIEQCPRVEVEERHRSFVPARPHASDEDRLVARVVWEHAHGRSLAEILDDPGIRARCTDRECLSLLERPELIRALAAHFTAETPLPA